MSTRVLIDHRAGGASSVLDAGGASSVLDAGGASSVLDAGGVASILDTGGASSVLDAGGVASILDAGGAPPVLDAGRVASATLGEKPVLRHPEKAKRPDNPPLPKPSWLRVRAPGHPVYNETRDIMRENKLVTVCEEAACPNIGECWSQRHATMMIMGGTCTRACAFCNVSTGMPDALDPDEPARVGDAVAKLGLRHVVITSVDRDDLADGGAAHFVAVIRAIRAASPGTTIEILTPDFLRKPAALARLAEAPPDVFNHNLETVPRLYPTIRPGARYYHSLRLLDEAKRAMPGVFTKSGLMVGLGEERPEIGQVMDDLRIATVDFLTLGQYLAPTPKHAPVARFVPPDEFSDYATTARVKGFLLVSATPLTRSSYHADADFAALQAARRTQMAA